MRFEKLLVISITFAFLTVSDIWAGPYVGVTLNYFDTTQSDANPVSHGDSTGSGFVVGDQTDELKTWLFPRPAYYGVEIECNKAQTRKGWGGTTAGVFGTLRSEPGEMGHALLRIGAVNTQIRLSDEPFQSKTSPAFGLGWGAMASGYLGFELTGTGIFGKVVGNDELSVFGFRLLYAW
jgi:hypothetical protein